MGGDFCGCNNNAPNEKRDETNVFAPKTNNNDRSLKSSTLRNLSGLKETNSSKGGGLDVDKKDLGEKSNVIQKIKLIQRFYRTYLAKKKVSDKRYIVIDV